MPLKMTGLGAGAIVCLPAVYVACKMEKIGKLFCRRKIYCRPACTQHHNTALRVSLMAWRYNSASRSNETEPQLIPNNLELNDEETEKLCFGIPLYAKLSANV